MPYPRTCKSPVLIFFQLENSTLVPLFTYLIEVMISYLSIILHTLAEIACADNRSTDNFLRDRSKSSLIVYGRASWPKFNCVIYPSAGARL